MKSVRSFLSVLLLASYASIALGAPTRRALVIGNDSYPGNSLQNARNDARGVAEALTALGYASTVLLDANRREFGQAVDRFANAISPGDVAIVYYAGHGLQVSGENYLVPVDFHVSDETDVRYQGYALSSLLDKLSEHGAATQIVVLDACRDNPFLRSRSVSAGWATIGSSAGSFLAFGTSPGSTASDDPDEGHGLFTKSLLKFMQSDLDVEQMFQAVRQDVIQSSNGRQVPWTASSLIGSFHLDPKADLGAPLLKVLMPTTIGPLNSEARALTSYKSRTTSARVPVAQSTAASDDQVASAVEDLRALHTQKALATIQTVLQSNPVCIPALRILGTTLHLLGRDTEATSAFDRAIELDPKDGISYVYRCLTEVSVGNPAAQGDCEQALALQNNLANAHLGLALNSSLQGDLEKAYAEVTRAISINPDSSLGFSLRGDLAADKHRGLAQQDYQRATKLAFDGGK